MSTTKRGKDAEAAVLAFLQAKGWLLCAQNFRFGRFEIDLVMQTDDTLVFVEVKLRKNNDFGYPEDFVTEAQKGRIRATAENFIENNAENFKAIRFDIAAVVLLKNTDYEITLLEDAF